MRLSPRSSLLSETVITGCGFLLAVSDLAADSFRKGPRLDGGLGDLQQPLWAAELRVERWLFVVSRIGCWVKVWFWTLELRDVGSGVAGCLAIACLEGVADVEVSRMKISWSSNITLGIAQWSSTGAPCMDRQSARRGWSARPGQVRP